MSDSSEKGSMCRRRGSLRSLVSASAIALAIMTHAACGGPRHAIDVRLTDHGVQILKSVPSGDVEFRITNGGTRDHNLKIVGGGLEIESPVVEPGKTATLAATLPTSRFDTFCAVGDHTSKERNEAGVTITAAPAQ